MKGPEMIKSAIEGMNGKNNSPDVSVGEVLIVSNGLDDFCEILKSLVDIRHHKLAVVSSIEASSLQLALKKRNYDYIFLNVDLLEHMGISIIEVIDQLREFRCAAPGVALILLSVSFGRDDSELHRLEICDASLRLPVSQSRLLQAMREACANNIVWCQRRLSA